LRGNADSAAYGAELTEPEKPRRKARKEAQAETRERILVAAAACFARKGFAGSSVDDITAEAGFSRGAFYSNFRSKDEVLILLFERDVEEDIAYVEAGAPRLKDVQDLWTLIGDRQRTQSANVDWCLLASEFQLYARRHPDRAAPIKRAYERHHAELARVLDRLADETGVLLPMPAPRIIAVVTGTLRGILTQRLVDELTPKGLESDAVNLILAGIKATSSRKR
jgi:AcrR family transcriptional regulator